MRNFLTNRHKNYWRKRKIDWKVSYFQDHPHRELIIKALRGMQFGSLIEVGCASGFNLLKIRENFPYVQIGGVDINRDAIETAKEMLPDAEVLEVSSADKLFLSDKSSDVILTDACLIYFDPFKIDSVIKEIKRVARNNVLFVELHSSSFWERLFVRLTAGYNLYNYKKLLEKHGFYDVELYKIPKEVWPGMPWANWGFVIAAKL